jgi:hypothetical protein
MVSARNLPKKTDKTMTIPSETVVNKQWLRLTTPLTDQQQNVSMKMAASD